MPIPTAAEIDVTNLDETIQMSIATQRSIEDFKAQQNVEKVKEHMMDEELEQLLEGTENVDVDAFMDDVLNSQEDPSTRIEPMSDKESPKVTKSTDMLDIHDDEVEEESVKEEFELRMREKGKVATEDALSFVDKEKLQELTVTDSTPSSSSPKPKTRRFKRKKFHQLAKHLHSTIEEFLPLIVGDRVNEIAKKTVPLYVDEGLLLDKQKTQADVAVMIFKAMQKVHENLHAEIILQVNNAIANSIPLEVDSFLRKYMSNNIIYVHPTQAPASSAQDVQYQMMKNDEKLRSDDFAKRKKTSEHGTYTVGESSSEQYMDQEPNPSDLGTQEQLDEFNAWMDGFGTDDDDDVPTEEVSLELMEEISEEINETQLKKVVDYMLRQRCNTGEEHQYHVDQMQNYLKNDNV
ncbi:hypothetical protein Tco_1385441 [Tanacetum coccineum]